MNREADQRRRVRSDKARPIPEQLCRGPRLYSSSPAAAQQHAEPDAQTAALRLLFVRRLA